jgi:ABC-type transport system involved in multi-copper enzyme maturation permease subunit
VKVPTPTAFGAVFHAEVLFNLKRAAPYALAILFGANAALWWGAGPAVERGWATNSDFYIVRLYGGFMFMTLPLFIAMMMGDPVIRDFRTGIDPLIFSKPVTRAEYLLGKFLGNFFVLVCCQAVFALTLLALQVFSTSGMVVLPPRVLPYFTHFGFFVVVSSLALAAICFAVGTLTRSLKIVFGLATAFYAFYLAWQNALKGLPLGWRIVLDPLLFNIGGEVYKGQSADWVNQLAIGYDAGMVANRALMVLVSAACLAIVHARFSSLERAAKRADDGITTINLSAAAEAPPRDVAATPEARAAAGGARAGLRQLAAALAIELRLLRAENSVVVVLPLATLVCVAELALYGVAPTSSYSAAYAGRTAESLLLFLFAIAVFYTGEAMHRDRELKIEPVLWSAPVPDYALLLSKALATLLLSASAVALVGLGAMALQAYKGHTPIEASTYLAAYSAILVPSAIFMIAAATAASAALRDKHLAYAACLAAGGGFYFLVSQGYNHWSYNFVLYRLWSASDLTGGERLAPILAHRVYTLAVAAACLWIAHLCFERPSGRRRR